MGPTTVRRSIPIGALLAIISATAFVSFQAGARGQGRAPATGPQPTNTVIAESPRYIVRHMMFPVGASVPMHPVGKVGDTRFDIMIQLTPAEFQGQVDDKKNVSDKPGTIWEIPSAPSQHAFANLSQQPIDVIVVQLK